MVNAVVERVGPEPGDAGHVLRVAHDVDRQALLGARLGDVEAGARRRVTIRARERGLAVGPGGERRHLVAPADPAGAGEVDDQVRPARGDVEELAVPGDVLDERAVQRVQRRVEGLQRAEGRQVDAGDRAVDEPAPQVQGQRFHLGQLGHGAESRSTRDSP